MKARDRKHNWNTSRYLRLVKWTFTSHTYTHLDTFFCKAIGLPNTLSHWRYRTVLNYYTHSPITTTPSNSLKFKISIKMHTRTIVALMSTAIAVGIVAAQTPVWSEEFNGDSLDTNVWSYDLGAGGWGNGELQTYREENAVVRDGNLLITVQREGSGGFSSARIKTENKLSFKYGIVQANISAPDVIAGLWPAFWTMGNDFAQVGWPAAGELGTLHT